MIRKTSSPTPPPATMSMEDNKPDLSSFEYYKHELHENRKAYAYKISDLFQSLELMSETEFFEIVSTLDGDGLQIGAMIEKFRKFKKS